MTEEELYEQFLYEEFLRESEQEPEPELPPEVVAREKFDQLRPRIADDVVGEDAGRSIDAGILGMGQRFASLGRGIQNLNPMQTEEQERELDEAAAYAEKLANETYAASNPIASAIGSFGATAPTMALPGGLPAQMAYGAVEAGLEHTSDDNAAIDAAVGGVSTGIFGKAFDLLGRAFGNTVAGAGEYLTGSGPKIAGKTDDEAKRLIRFADDEGVNLTPAQRTQSRKRMADEARLASQPSGHKIVEMREAQTERINEIVFDRFGIEGASRYTPEVRQAVDAKINKAFREVEDAIPNTSRDSQFLDEAAEIATNNNLTKEQAESIDNFVMEIAEGMDGRALMDLRKKIQKSIQNNYRGGNGDYADAMHDLVDAIDGLVERSASTKVAMKYADVRDMSRMRMALERGSAVSQDGNVTPASFYNSLRRIYKGEFERARGHSNPATERVFDAARLNSMLSDKIGNSGTATRQRRSPVEWLSDTVINEPAVDLYLNHPTIYGLLDPMGTLGTAAAYRGGRAASMDGEDLENLLGIE